MTAPAEVDGFDHYRFPDSEDGRSVYWRGGSGRPAVILLHELPGMSEECLDLARELADPVGEEDGYQVHLPLLFGAAGQEGGLADMARWMWCVRREFSLLSRSRRSPITDWVSALAKEVARRSGSPTVAVIGMCLTGGIGFGLIADASVGAVVASQPSLPSRLGPWHDRDLGVPFEEFQASCRDGAPVLAMRYQGDPLCPRARLGRLAQAYGVELPPAQPDEVLDVTTDTGLRIVEVPGRRHALLTFDRDQHAIAAVRELLATALTPQSPDDDPSRPPASPL